MSSEADVASHLDRENNYFGIKSTIKNIFK